MKKIFGIISNVISLVFVFPFSAYFFLLGLLLLSLDSFTISLANLLTLTAMALFIISPLLCILGIVMSVIFRAKGKYLYSYLIQLMPFVSIVLGVFLGVVTMIWCNP